MSAHRVAAKGKRLLLAMRWREPPGARHEMASTACKMVLPVCAEDRDGTLVCMAQILHTHKLQKQMLQQQLNAMQQQLAAPTGGQGVQVHVQGNDGDNSKTPGNDKLDFTENKPVEGGAAANVPTPRQR